MFGWVRGKRTPQRLDDGLSAGGIPTVKFDASRVTDAVKTEIRKCVAEIDGPTTSQRETIYDAVLRSVSAGGDLHTLHSSLMSLGIAGMTTGKASTIGMRVNRRATTLMDKSRQQSLGIEYARWMYSGAPCMANTKQPTPTDIEQDNAHKAANGQRFKISQGMFLNGKWTWPGDEGECRCVSGPIIPGFE
jgi:uncharacterized protein with gpF-like domain